MSCNKYWMAFVFLKRFSISTFLLSSILVVVSTVVSFASERPLKAVVTVGMVADVVKAVGRDDVDVKTLIGTGIDPHAYRQTRSDVSLLASADVIFRNGLHLEAQLDPLLDQLATKKPVIAVAEALPENRLIEAEGFSGRYDPHAWMDPALWLKTAYAVRDALIELRPDKKDAFVANATAFVTEVQELRSKVSADRKSVV